MPVSNTNTYTVSTANGVTTVFPYDFTLLDVGDLVLTVDDVVITTGFTVSGVGDAAGGNITFSVAPANGANVLRERVVALTRSTDYQYVGSLSSEVLDSDFDRLWLALQRANREASRALKLPLGHAGSAEVPALVANAYPRANSAGSGIEWVPGPEISGTTQSNLVDFLQSGAGAVGRTAQAKMREIVSADDFGAVGNGVANDTTAIQNALNASVGKLLLLGPQKTYGITAITIPAGVTMLANGSTFKKLAASGTYGITVSGGLTCDKLVLVSPGSSTDNGIKIAGGNINVDYIEASSTAVDSLFGLRVEDTTPATIKNVRIGTIKTSNYRSAVQFFNGQYFDIGRVQMTSYITGLYVKDLKDSTVNGGNASTASPMATGDAGENGLLIESTTDFASENLTFRGFHVADAPEHAFRIGSERPVRNIFYYGCSSTNSGSIGNTSTGGAAFKVLHGNTNATFHENINVIGFDAVDCSNSTGGLNNLAAFQIGKLKGGQFSDITIRKRNNTYSCKFGFQVFASEDIEINNPNITDCMRHAFQFIQAAVVSPAYPTTMKRVHVNGGHAQVMESASTSAVARFTVEGGTFTDVSIRGTTLSGGGLAALHDAPTGSGAYVDCKIDIIYRDPLNTAGGPPVQNPNTILLNYNGPYYGTYGPNAANGSIYQDTTNGLVRVRKDGAWLSQTEQSGTWTPTPVLVTNVDAATVNGTWRWMRIGSIVQFSGSLDIDNTTGSALSEVGIDLPVASDFTNFGDAGGTAAASTPNSLCGIVQADVTNNRLAIKWQAVSTTDNRSWFCTGSYQVK